MTDSLIPKGSVSLLTLSTSNPVTSYYYSFIRDNISEHLTQKQRMLLKDMLIFRISTKCIGIECPNRRLLIAIRVAAAKLISSGKTVILRCALPNFPSGVQGDYDHFLGMEISRSSASKYLGLATKFGYEEVNVRTSPVPPSPPMDGRSSDLSVSSLETRNVAEKSSKISAATAAGMSPETSVSLSNDTKKDAATSSGLQLISSPSDVVASGFSSGSSSSQLSVPPLGTMNSATSNANCEKAAVVASLASSATSVPVSSPSSSLSSATGALHCPAIATAEESVVQSPVQPSVLPQPPIRNDFTRFDIGRCLHLDDCKVSARGMVDLSCVRCLCLVRTATLSNSDLLPMTIAITAAGMKESSSG